MANFLREAQRPVSARARALKSAALSAVTLAVVAPGFAQAQQAGGDIQEITITGSHIKAPNLTSDSPVTAVNDEVIKQQGTTDVSVMLNSLPAVTADQGNTTSAFGSDGTSHVNLRALGALRTLTLIDGRRIGPSDPTNEAGAAADISFIPAPLIRSVDVLTGGASAVYGSDAVAGVVNFHLLRNFEGVEFDETFSGYQNNDSNGFESVIAATNKTRATLGAQPITYPNSNWDGFTRESTVIMGINSGNSKGNITLYFDWRKSDQVTSAQRDWSACVAASTGSAFTCGGSGTSTYGSFYDVSGNNTYYLDPAGSRTLIPYTTYPNALKYNYATTAALQASDKRWEAGALGHYEVNEHIDLYSEVMFMDNEYYAQESPSGLFAGTGPTGTINLTCNDNPAVAPFMSPQEEAAICDDPNHTKLGTTVAVTTPGLRFANAPRAQTFQHEDYRVLGGARGDIDNVWSYDVSAQFWQANLNNVYSGDVISSNAQAGLDSGTLDIFQLGSVTSAGAAAAGGPGLQLGHTREYDVNATITGDLGSYGIKSPWSQDGIAVAGGVEWRRDELAILPDANFQQGAFLGGNQLLPVSGAEAVTEEYFEVRVPVVEDLPFIRAIDINPAFRHSDYTVDNTNNQGFSLNTWKIDADYAPVDDVRFRGGYNRAARAPNVEELSVPSTKGLFGFSSQPADPCSGTSPTASLAACVASGVPANLYGTGKIQDCFAQQCGYSFGGNTGLKPEEADTWTWGVNLVPRFIPGLNASVDYWDVKVNNYINAIAAQTSLTACLSGQTALCSNIVRGNQPGNLGQVWGGGSQLPAGGYIVGTYVNEGFQHNRGLDFDLNYKRNLGELVPALNGLGAVSLNLTATYLLQDTTFIVSPGFDCAGLFGATCGNPAPTWRHTLRTTWDTPWGASVSVAWRYLSSVTYDGNSSNPLLNSGSFDAIDNRIPAYSYIDLSTAYTLWDKYTLRVGVNNLMDKDPPVVGLNLETAGANGNSYATYDTLGRMIFMSFSAKF